MDELYIETVNNDDIDNDYHYEEYLRNLQEEQQFNEEMNNE